MKNYVHSIEKVDEILYNKLHKEDPVGYKDIVVDKNWVCVFEITKFFEKELGFKKTSLKSNIKISLKHNIFSSLFKKHFVALDNSIRIISEKETNTEVLLSNLEQVKNDFQQKKEDAKYFLKYHPDKFKAKALFVYLEEMNMLELIENLKKMRIKNIKDLSLKNFNLENIEIDIEKVEKYVENELIVNKLKSDSNKIDMLQEQLFLEEWDFKISNFDRRNVVEVTGDFTTKHWSEIGETNLESRIINESKKYNDDFFFLTRTFFNNHNEQLLDFKRELKEELQIKYSKIVINDLLSDNDKFKQLLLQHKVIKAKLINNNDLFTRQLEFKQFCNDRRFLKHQQFFFRKIQLILKSNNINSHSSLLGMKLEKFINLFDPTTDKKIFNTFKKTKQNPTLKEEIFDFVIGKSEFLTRSSDYSNTVNNMGGFFLILFDILRIVEGKSKKFDIYKSVFANNKIDNITYNEKSIFYIILITKILFNSEMEEYSELLINSFIKDKDFIEKPTALSLIERMAFIKYRHKHLLDFSQSTFEQVDYIKNAYDIFDDEIFNQEVKL